MSTVDSLTRSVAVAVNVGFTVIAGAGSTVYVREIHCGEVSTNATVTKDQWKIQRTTGGATPVAQTPEKYSSRTAGVGFTADSTWTTAPTLAGSPLLFVSGFRQFSAPSIWQPPRPQATPALINGEQYDLRNSDTGGAPAATLIVDETPLEDDDRRVARRPVVRGWITRPNSNKTSTGHASGIGFNTAHQTPWSMSMSVVLVPSRNIMALLQAAGGATPITASDSAALTESVSIVASVATTDAATLADATPSIAATLATSDSGALAEGTTAIGVALVDSSVLSDPTPSIAASLATTDAATLADATPSIAASLSTTDAAAMADATPSVAASVTLTDAATLAESPSVIGLALVDSATLADATPTIAAALATSDVASLSDATPSIAASLATTDAATLANPTPSIAATLTTSDAATLLDATPSIAAALATTDAASLGDSTPSIAASLSTTDSGALGDSGSVSQPGGTTPSVSDAFTLTELATLAVTLTTSDSATLSEGATGLLATLNTADAASLAEQATLIVALLVAIDSLTLSESISVVAIGASGYVPFRPIGFTVSRHDPDATTAPYHDPDGTTTPHHDPDGSSA